jgi:hypothetical protein
MLRVWEVRERGVILCTEEEYNKTVMEDGVVTALGFPMSDVKHSESDGLGPATLTP